MGFPLTYQGQFEPKTTMGLRAFRVAFEAAFTEYLRQGNCQFRYEENGIFFHSLPGFGNYFNLPWRKDPVSGHISLEEKNGKVVVSYFLDLKWNVLIYSLMVVALVVFMFANKMFMSDGGITNIGFGIIGWFWLVGGNYLFFPSAFVKRLMKIVVE